MLQPNEFKIYNASAGAGKTYTLVKEYLSILLSSTNPYAFESILAITFTNKAANEMKERILQQLVKFSQNDYFENSDLINWSVELNLSPEEIHERSKKILVKILHQYSRFSVSTIDKFNLRLMKSFAQDLGLSSNFNVEMDTVQILEESVNQLFSKIGEDEVLTSVLIEIALDNLMENRSWDLSKELVKRSKELYSDTHLTKIAKLQEYQLEEFNQFRRTVYQKVAQKKHKLQSIAEQALNLVKERGILLDEFSYGTNGFIGFFTKFLNDKFELPTTRHFNFVENEDPKKYVSSKASAHAKSEIPQIAPQLKEYFHLANEELKDLPIWEEIQKTIAALSIINEVEKAVELLKEDNNVLLISEFNKIISANLQEQPSGFIYERIGNRFHHYFIDEFQDTSTLQWKNLWPLIENARAGSDTVMLVGDAKQSIYRFRGGNPEQMLGLIERKDELNINVENLPRNWRSFENIIEFNNEFYTKIGESLPVDTYRELYVSGNNQLTNHKKGGFVQLNFISDSKVETETYKENTLAQLLKNIESIREQGFQYAEIAILFRRNNHGELIAEYLAEKNIPILSAESLLVGNSPEIQAIELFFKTISNPEDKVSKAEFLLKLFEIGILTTADITAEIKTVLNSGIPQLVQYLKNYEIDLGFIHQPSVSLYDFTEKTIEAFGFAQKNSAYVQFFLDYILEYSSQHEYSLPRFLENWEIKKEDLSISSPGEIDAIQLMSIHKSKGLEFPVVILPFTDWGDRIQDPKFWIPIQDEALPFNEFLVNSFGKLEETSPEIRAIIERERNEFLLDNLNILYVATTRAVEQLYIITKKLEKPNSSVASYFHEHFPGEDEQILKGEKGKNSQPKAPQVQPIEISFVVEDWENRIQISKESSKRWKKRKEIVYGELVHDLMKHIRYESEIEPTLQMAVNAGQISQEEISLMQELMQKIVLHPTLNPFFQPSLKILNEREFLDENGIIYRPDRIVLKENSCTIIDYKTGLKKAQDEVQVKHYAENLAKLGFEIQGVFIVYIQDEIEINKVL